MHPLSMGELLDRSASFWRRHLKELVQLTSAFAVVEFAVAQALERAFAQSGLSALGGTRGAPLEDWDRIKPLLLVYLWSIPVLTLSSTLGSVAVARFTGSAQMGRPEPVRASLLTALKRTGTVLAALLGFLLALVVLTVLGALPGAGLFVLVILRPSLAYAMAFLGPAAIGCGILLALLPWFLRATLLGPILAFDAGSGLGVWRRAGRLLSGRTGPHWTDQVWLRASITLTLLTAFLAVVGLLGQLPLDILRTLYGRSAFDPAAVLAVPAYAEIPAKLLELACLCLFRPLSAVFMALFYLDCRSRKEGLDLELRLDALAPVEARA